MITMFRSRFRSRDTAFAAAARLYHLVPGHDYAAWPDRGCWVVVMRYRDDDGHIRFKFVGPEAPASKPEPHSRNPQEWPMAHNIDDRGDESPRRHRRVYVEAMQQ